MRKLILSMMVTLDGYMEGHNGALDWHHVDEEFNQFAVDQLNAVDSILFGRKTYEMMAAFWPTPFAAENSPLVAEKMNSYPKFVFSTTMTSAAWQNTRLIQTQIKEEVSMLKSQPGKDLIIFGSSTLASSFTEMGLIDEFRLIINPVVLTRGKPLLGSLSGKQNLVLTDTKVFRSGNVLLCYQPAKPTPA